MKVGYRPEIVQTPMMVKQSSWDSWWWDWMRSPVWMRWRWGEGALKNSRPEMEIDWLEYPNTNWARVANLTTLEKRSAKDVRKRKRKTEHEPPLLNVSRNRDQWWLISGGHVCKCMQTERVVGFYVFFPRLRKTGQRMCIYMFVCVRERESCVMCILQRVTQWV